VPSSIFATRDLFETGCEVVHSDSGIVDLLFCRMTAHLFREDGSGDLAPAHIAIVVYRRGVRRDKAGHDLGERLWIFLPQSIEDGFTVISPLRVKAVDEGGGQFASDIDLGFSLSGHLSYPKPETLATLPLGTVCNLIAVAHGNRQPVPPSSPAVVHRW
jgi:hypothetical protein